MNLFLTFPCPIFKKILGKDDFLFLRYCLLKAELVKKTCQLLVTVGRLQYSIIQVVANTRIYLLLEENTTLIGATNVLTVNECINGSVLVLFAMQKK